MTHLVVALLSIIIVIIGVTWFKWHAFISLTIATLFLAIFSGLSLDKIVSGIETGVGGTLGHLVGILALGTILGMLMAESGAGLQVSNFFVRTFGVKRLPWAMLLAGFITGIPVFFEVGILIVLPLVISMYKTSKQNLLLIGLPAVAGLSITHGLVPPHPGAVAAIGIYNANMGKVLLYSLIIAIPSAIIAGPLFAKWISKRIIPENEPELIKVEEKKNLPGTGTSFFVILLPVILMVFSAIVPFFGFSDGMKKFFTFIGSPLIALLISVFVAMYFLGFRQGLNKNRMKTLVEECFLPVGSIIAIIGAGGGFKQILIDSGVGNTIGEMAQHFSLSPLVLAFIIAGLIRIATGSATVALTTAAGIVSPIIQHMTGVNLELLVIATGAGSLMFSHVNDAGFWMVKEYLGLSVPETLKTWTVLETILSFVAFGLALVLNAII
ncbi:gluconate:H+ symporter [Bacillus sp. FJAT-49736]|uniref:GntT/GntP/DsdX family permease n=1 Tax=Bacillus sp. FJAT-49736 TaxID=2833582 RepID=UPI001BC9788C|nr:gluconate:H+ symporter [Bacillus sp. FJAT-49736]MBS4174797.1 gluconate:H+ symporter [Bacillus sp. FJAT-49736]MBS4175546.1 gluconate:H+ symporter [Bacillus sp. FJAT-49736]